LFNFDTQRILLQNNAKPLETITTSLMK